MNRLHIILLFYLSFQSCLEEIDLKTEVGFESAVVIEATITNELKPQLVQLSRAYELGQFGPAPESNAQVRVLSDNGNSFDFVEIGAGRYISNEPFAAQPNINYQLEITTSDGRSYGSTSEQLTNSSQINDLYALRDLNENGMDGVSIYVDSFDPSGNSRYYRYTYEETYKIVAPRYNPQDLVVISRDFPFVFELQPKPEQQLTCYNTVTSNTIIIEDTNQFQEDRIDKFRVRFLGRDNYIISHRYSILVTQYIQSSQAHEYYRSLKELSIDDSLLSQSQPGFLSGNVFAVTDESEMTVGFFEVSSVDKRRIYFNYSDLFPDEPLPPYQSNCTPVAPLEFSPFIPPGPPPSPLIDALDAGFKYLDNNDSPMEGEGPYNLVQPACGNCTVLGNNYPPPFWEE